MAEPLTDADTDPIVKIEALGSRADGIARHRGRVVYVPYTVPGDEVRISCGPGPGSALRGHVQALIRPGPDRVESVCPHFGACGGCSLQMLSSAAYGRWLVQRIQTALNHQGIEDVTIEEPVLSPSQSRRRIVLQARRTGAGVLLGFHEAASKRLVDVVDCPVSADRLVGLLAPLRRLLGRLLAPKQSGRVTATLADNGIDVLLEMPSLPGPEEREALAEFARAGNLAALHVSDGYDIDPIVIARTPVIDFDGVSVALPPGAFVQATAAGQEALTEFVTEEIGDVATVADLFAGVGTLAVPITRVAAVTAFEGAADLVKCLEETARHLSSRKALSVVRRDLFRRPLLAEETTRFDTVVLDPPRAGAKAQFAQLARGGPRKVIGISCNPNTFARDARILLDGGYRLVRIRPVGQFLWSHHVELAASFVREDG